MRLSVLWLTPLLLLTGCGSSPDIALTSDLSHYATAQTQCNDYLDGKESLSNSVETECDLFLKRLDKANSSAEALDNEKMKKGERKEKKTEYARERNKLKQQYGALSKSIKTATLVLIKEDNVATFTNAIEFPENKVNKTYYAYMLSKAPLFDNNPHYIEYKHKASVTLVTKAQTLLKQGKQKKAQTLFLEAAEMGNIQAARSSALLYEKNDVDEAIKWHLLAVDGGEVLSSFNLGRLYATKGEKELSLEAYQKAAAANNAKAQYQLYLHFQKSDDKESLSWLKKSAKNADAQAQYTYALLLVKETKTDQAIALLQQASQNNYQRATVYLGNYYYELKFYGRAFKLLSQVESADAFYLLAKMTEEGAGTPKDLSKAYILYSRADGMGNKDARKAMVRVNASLDKAQKAQAQQQKVLREKQMATMIKQCGVIATPKTVKKKGTRVHITGVASAPAGNRNFVIYGDDGEDYFITNTRGLHEDKRVDISVVASGRTASVSVSGDEDESDIIQLKYLKECVLEQQE